MPQTGVAVLIPARRASTRLPNKLLLADTGTPLIIHTCERAAQAYGPEAVIVCSDDPAITDVVRAAGFTAVMTRADHQSGTDRIAEVANTLEADICINVQGDEPEIDPGDIRLVADLLVQHDWAMVATLATADTTQDDPNAVKVVLGHGDRALWFSRAPVIWNREAARPVPTCHRHIGIYAYRRDVLVTYAGLPASRLEQTECLEQLRALEAGLGIACGVIDHAPAGIDVAADYAAFCERHAARASESP